MNNQQKHFHKIYCDYCQYNHGRVNHQLVKEEIEYMSRTYDVKFFKYMSWKTRNVIIDDYDFGRFDIRFKPDKCGTLFLIFSKNHKHPHAWPDFRYVNFFGKRGYNSLCVGDETYNAFSSGRLLDAYRIYNNVVKNIDEEHACTMSYTFNCEDKVIDLCHNFKRKNITRCSDCTNCRLDNVCVNPFCGELDD